MARSLQVLSFFSRLGAPSVISSVNARFASRGANKAWMGQSHVQADRGSNRTGHSGETSNEELELEDVEDKLQALIHEGRKRQRTVKYHILRRQMTPSGAPERKLTWGAIEQIRYLKQNQPEEWTVERLAEGFSVSPDVILRVLRSKFVPSPERKAKQNAKVMARLSQQVLPSGTGTQQDRLKLPERCTPAILPSGSTEGALIPVANQTRVIQDHGLHSLAKSPAPVTVHPTHFTAGISEDATVRGITEDSTTDADLTGEDEESWDGQVLTEEELEEFMEMEKPSPAAQVGNDFFDAEGNFLYRI
ncbi:neugrin [Archocentrus centrarchus]|uniref:neugrin n=1 Tax=Archocentrus centrarchus TaxID=63155 RepID=UPI0011EA4F83|nr:neugrin [Archocentrus centrarchus]